MKKLFLKGFVTMVALCLSIAVQAQQTTPYFEDFEAMTTGSVPTGWDNSASTTATSLTGGYVWGVYETGGNKMIRMNNYWVNNGVACINTPAITLPAAGGSCQLVFKYAHTASCGDFKVKISTDNGTTFTDLATYQQGTGTSYSDPGEFTEVTISLNSYLGNNAIIQFWTTANYGNGAIFVDDVEVGPEPTCFQPTNLQISNLTATGVDFTFSASGHGETMWEYLCIPAGTTPDWTDSEALGMTSGNVFGLIPNTSYNLMVRSYCSATDQSKVTSIKFRTLCAAVTPEQLGMIGFEESEGFITGSGNLNGSNCWYAGSFQATSNTYIPSVVSSSYSAFEGDDYLNMRGQTNAAGTQKNDSAYVILPEMTFTGGISTYHMQMRIRKGSNTSSSSTYSDTLFVALLSDPANPKNFEIVGHIIATSTDYQLADVNFAGTTATGNYIMLLAAAPRWATTTSKIANFYIDNIEVKKSKMTATPTNLAVNNIQPRSMEASWTGVSHARVMLSATQVDNPDTYTEWLVDTVVTTNPATIDIEPATRYVMYVQCFGTDTSEISTTPVAFESGCEPLANFPWIEDFEAFEGTENFDKPCWTNVHTEGTATAVAKIEGSRNGKNNTNQLKFEHYGDSGEVVVVTLPEFDIPTANAYEFAISAYRTNDAYPNLVNDGVYVITEDANGGFDTLFIPHNITNPGTVGTENHDDWYTYSVVLPKAGVNSIKVRHLSEGGLAMYVDNFTVRAIPACSQVRHLLATDVQPRQASLGWDATGAANYQVVLTTVEIKPDTLATVPDSLIVYNDTVAANTAVATGLVPTVMYYAYVRGVCGAENGAWAASISFRTPCEDYTITATEKYFQGFEGLEDKVRYVPCWDFIVFNPDAYSTGSGQMVVSATKSGSYEARSGSMLFNYGNQYGAYNGANDTSIMVLPQTTNNVQDLRLKFWFTCPVKSAGDNSPMYFDTLVVGVITDIADRTTFTPVARFHADESEVYQLAETMFDEYTGAQGRIAIMRVPVWYHPSSWTNQYWGSIIDDVTIDLAPTCKKVTDVVASDVTDVTAKLSWKATNAASYNVIVADAAIDADAIDSAAQSHIVTAVSVAEDSVNLVSLQPMTTYYAYIVGDCGNGDIADASAACKFTTAMAAPYFQDFQASYILPSELTQYSTQNHVDSLLEGANPETPAVVTTNNWADWAVRDVYEPNIAVGIDLYTYNQHRMLATPAIVMHGADSLKLKFDLTKTAYGSTDPAEDSYNYDHYFYVMLANPEMTEYTMIASWTNDTIGKGDYSLRQDISTTPSDWEFDLSDYDGVYRIIFAAGSPTTSDDYMLYLDNIAITADATLAVVANNDIRGTVTGSTDETFLGAEVEITATPNDGYVFYQWSNGDNNATTTYTVAAKNDTITAIFVPTFVDFTITSDNEDMGTVTGSGHYAALDTVTISATANTGFVFSNWSDGNTDAVRTIIATEDLNLVAYFDTIKVNVTVSITGEGTVTGDGIYNYGDQVTLTATPDNGWEFTKWTMNETDYTDATLTFTITEDVTVDVVFTVKSAVEDVETVEYVAYAEDMNVVVDGVESHNVAVYDATGRLVKMINNASDIERINVQAAGVYIIRIDNNQTLRVVVK